MESSSVKHVCFVKWNAFSRVFKQGLALKAKYPDIKLTLICHSVLHSGDLFEQTFDEMVHIDQLGQWMKLFSPDIYHVCDDGQLHIPRYVMEHSEVPVVYDANDFTGMYGRGLTDDEKFILENMDGIATKFPVWALDWYIEQGVKIRAPFLEYFDYCCPDFFEGSSLMDKTKIDRPDKHIVHCGATAGSDQLPRGKNNYHGFWLPALLDQDYWFTVYTSPWDDVPEGYQHLLDKYLKFNIFKGKNQPEIQKIIKYYDYGANIHDFRDNPKPPIFEQTAYSHKLSTYLEAGLPIIVSENLKWIHEVIVERLGVGFGVTFDDELSSFREREEAADYYTMRERVREVRANEYNAYKQVERLVNFYESCIGTS